MLGEGTPIEGGIPVEQPKTADQLVDEWDYKDRYTQPGAGMQMAIDIKKSIETLKKEDNPIAKELEDVLESNDANSTVAQRGIILLRACLKE